MTDANILTMQLVIIFSVIGGVVVAVEYKNIKKMVIRVKTTSRERENYKKMAKMHFLKNKVMFRDAMLQGKIDSQLPGVEEGGIDGISIPYLDVTLISDDLKAAVNELNLPEEFKDELYRLLKDVPPERRMEFLIDFFS